MELISESTLKLGLCDRISSLRMPGEKKKAFANRCGVPQTTMSGYLNANRLPKIDHLISIAVTCNVTLDWLTTGHEIQPAYGGHSTSENFQMLVQEPEGDFDIPEKKEAPDLEFIKRLNEITRKAGGQSALSQIAGIPLSTLADFFNGSEPTRPQLIALAKAADKTISWLMTGEKTTCEGQATTKEPQIRLQKDQDSFDQAMNEFFEMLKNWQIDENGRSIKTAIEFVQEFPLRFPEMSEWLKKRKRDGLTGKLSKPEKNLDKHLDIK
jgi:transcriptional regulator with XRE-family HTH domain